ncbi:hypothetical protein AY606_14910 [Acinetobacter sp. SFB]|nr:hypothetical protein AY606_14910 [Acinetobacter sp. SFB]
MLLDSQPNDILGLAINRVHMNDRIPNPAFNATAECNVELNYSYYPTKWLMLGGNIQYVINPGATNNVDDALVLGLSSKVVF